MDLQPCNFLFFSPPSCGGYIRAREVRNILEKALAHHTSVTQNPSLLLQTDQILHSFLTIGDLIPHLFIPFISLPND